MRDSAPPLSLAPLHGSSNSSSCSLGSWVWDLSVKLWVVQAHCIALLPTQACGQKPAVLPNQGPQGKLNPALCSAILLSPARFPRK